VTEVRTITSGTSVDALVDALDRLIGNGVAVVGDLIISVGGVDLIRVDLRALLATVGTVGAVGTGDEPEGGPT
jgi:hypothetical protein